MTSAVFLSSAVLDAIQETPADIVARNPCTCQGEVIGVALEQAEGQRLGSLLLVILMKVRIFMEWILLQTPGTHWHFYFLCRKCSTYTFV